MRIIGRILGACWRVTLWMCCWPLGWYASHQAKKRRRHNELIRAIRNRPA